MTTVRAISTWISVLDVVYLCSGGLSVDGTPLLKRVRVDICKKKLHFMICSLLDFTEFNFWLMHSVYKNSLCDIKF
jgi:hypothetical protein